jgi:hypothetical protein
VKDWKAIAVANGLNLKDAELDRIASVLSALDETMQPLVRSLTPDVEPASVFHAGETGA